jgi:two-component system, NtrC family, nitrogen regulation sensor histidine kinase GlnL
MNAIPNAATRTDSDYPRRILDTMLTSVLVLDEALRVRFMNSAAEVLFASSFRQARAQRFQVLARCPESIVAALRQSLSDGHPFTEREVLLTLPGEQGITVDFTVLPLAADGGQLELLVELRQLDRQLRINREEHLLAQHNTARILIRNLAHEVKNPLGGLRGAAQLLERELPHPALREYTRIIIGEADRLRALVDRMLGPSHPPRHNEVNIHEVLERVRSLVLAENGPELHIAQDYDPSIPPLMGDADQLIQATLNIVRNAAQALEGRGTVVLRTRVQRRCNIGPKRHKLLAQSDVIDDGPGIPEQLREDIFYPMVSGAGQGSGLGLSIAQILVSQHGGLIEFTSRPGETVFSLLLPLETADG